MSVDSTVLPVTVLADAKTTRIELSLYNTTTPITTYTASSNGNIFTTSVAIDQTVLETAVQLIGRNYDPNAAWNPLTTYAASYRYADTNGNVQVAVQAGISGSLQPTWITNTPATITNIQLSSNTLTITSPGNTLTAGKQVYLTGLTNATFLNGLIVTVVTPGVAFTVTYIHADYLSAADTGTANAVTTDGGVLWANYGVIAITPTIQFTLLAYESGLAVAIAPPSGITAEKNQTDCILQWVTPDYPGFIGVRVMISTDRAGISPPYTQFGDLVTTVSNTEQTVINTVTNTAVNVPTAVITNVEISNGTLTVTAINSFVPGTVLVLTGLNNAVFLNDEIVTANTATGTQFTAHVVAQDYPSAPNTGTATSTISTNTVTSKQTVMAANFSSVDIPSSLINQDTFYALFSTVIQDTMGTNVLYESVQNGPLLCGFVNLRVVSPTDFVPALQRKEDIAGRLIGQIVRQIPTLDLSPRSEIRDIFIDPFSIECANMSVREWFARVSTSISAISQVDDTTGTGVSDPFQSSPYKQQIARAYGLSPQDTQTLINGQFVILGEQAGLIPLAASQSTGVLTFYTYQQPQSSFTVPQGAVVATVADANTPALNFVTQGQATVNISNLSSFYNSEYGWWAVSVPAQCSAMGSNGNVGAGTIRQVVSGVPSGLNVTNLVPAAYGTDNESNSHLAARIHARLVTGVDTGTRHGYLGTALSTPGIIGAQVVAAGDLEMIRDWDPIRQKHVFGCVDIYTRGTTLSQQDETAFFEYQNTGTYGQTSTYLPLLPVSGLKFQITGFSGLPYPLYDAVEIAVTRLGSTFYLGTERAQFDNVNGDVILNPNDMAYQYAGSTVTQARIPLLLNGTPATNQAAAAALTGAVGGTYAITMFARYESPFTLVPTLQPVLDIYSIVGQSDLTGMVPSSAIELIHTSDFLLDGGSNAAGDTVQVNIVSSPAQGTVTALSANAVTIDTGMDVPLDPNGNPIDVLSVRSADLSTLYKVGVDYKIVPVADLALGTYHTYGLQILASSVLVTSVSATGSTVTLVANNEFGAGSLVSFSGFVNPNNLFLNSQTNVPVASATPTQFTISLSTSSYPTTADNGLATGSAIRNSQSVVVAYNKFALYERLTYVGQTLTTVPETQVLNGTLPTTLDNNGFVNNVWLPASYSSSQAWTYPVNDPYLALILDGWDGLYGADGGLDVAGSAGLVGAQIPYASRYIKVTYNNDVIDVVKKEGIDFTLTVDPVSGTATIARILTGTIPDGGTVNVSYFYAEPFDFSTQYPAYVQILVNELAATKHAAADVLVKAMTANPVDITLAVTLDANASPEAVDSTIRTVANIVLDNAETTLYQSELIGQIQAITGVQSVQIPLIKCAKSDGSYDIGVVIPTGTSWTPLRNDPAFSGLTVPQNSWISTSQVLPDSTVPSGGEAIAVVDFLYEGQIFRRATSVQDFLTNSIPAAHIASTATPGSFYIIGTNDRINSSTPLASAYWQKVMLVVPQDVVNPGNLSYLCTYQVFNEGGAKDVTVSSTEYLSNGRITINYVTSAS